jgi:hypothetical protein
VTRYIILNDRTRFGGETGAGLMRNRCSFTSKDMAEEWDAAFAYAIINGWDPDEDDPEDSGDPMTAMAKRWDWDEPLVAFLRDAHERFMALPDRHEGEP